jgi:hypothetical protein
MHVAGQARSGRAVMWAGHVALVAAHYASTYVTPGMRMVSLWQWAFPEASGRRPYKAHRCRPVRTTTTHRPPPTRAAPCW